MVTYYLLLQISTQKSGGKFYEKNHEYHLPHTFHMACIIPFVPPLRMSKARHVFHRHDRARRFFLQFLFVFLFYRIIYGITPSILTVVHIKSNQKKHTHTHTHTQDGIFNISSNNRIDTFVVVRFPFVGFCSIL